MLDLMSKVRLVRHSVLGFFHRFTLENKELIEKETLSVKRDDG